MASGKRKIIIIKKKDDEDEGGKRMYVRQVARRWCFTIWAHCEERWEEEIKEKIEKNDMDERMTYMIANYEVSPSEGKLHWQGYAEFGQTMRITAVKECLGAKTAHLKAADGKGEQNIHYCSKPVDRCICDNCENAAEANKKWKHNAKKIEYGKMNHQGKRKDLEFACEDCRDLSIDQMNIEHPSVMARYSNFIKSYKISVQKLEAVKEGFYKPIVTVIYGPPGTGKTRNVTIQEGDDLFKFNGGRGNWWDGYEGQEAILFDEFNGGVDYNFILELLSGNGVSAQVKGGFVFVKPKRVYFVSNHKMEDWDGWREKKCFIKQADGTMIPFYDKRSAFYRRIRMILKMEKRSNTVEYLETQEEKKAEEIVIAPLIGIKPPEVKKAEEEEKIRKRRKTLIERGIIKQDEAKPLMEDPTTEIKTYK